MNSSEWAKPEQIFACIVNYVGPVATDCQDYRIGMELEAESGFTFHVCLTRDQAVNVRDLINESLVHLGRLNNSEIDPRIWFPGS